VDTSVEFSRKTTVTQLCNITYSQEKNVSRDEKATAKTFQLFFC